MSVLPQLEHDLIDAASRRLRESAREAGQPARRHSMPLESRRAMPRLARATRATWRRPRRPRPSGLRLALTLTACLLASATVGLAASGVLLTGSPVPPSGTTNPKFGLGVPSRHGALLLPLRIPDPEGGPPWGMRIVETTRGESCLQIGRVQRGELGQLGIDGIFHDDRQFHPIPIDALPPVTRSGIQPAMGARADCRLPGKAIAGEMFGLDRNGAHIRDARHAPLRRLRDVSFGVLGPDAVRVAYNAGGKAHSEAVVPGVGAYLIVLPASPGEQENSGYASIGTYGRLQARGAVTAITYRLKGKLCERGRPQSSWSNRHVPHKCPFFHVKPSERPPAKMPDLHEKIHVHLSIRNGLVTAMQVSFAAPYAIDSAQWEYALTSPPCSPPGPFTASSYLGAALQRDVAEGATVRFHVPNPFADPSCKRHPLTVEVLYRHAEGGRGTLVGTANVPLPPGTKPLRTEEPVVVRHRLIRRGGRLRERG